MGSVMAHAQDPGCQQVPHATGTRAAAGTEASMRLHTFHFSITMRNSSGDKYVATVEGHCLHREEKSLRSFGLFVHNAREKEKVEGLHQLSCWEGYITAL